jgi:hypothetical protein
MGVNLIPFVDEDRIRTVVARLKPRFAADELERNKFGKPLVFFNHKENESLKNFVENKNDLSPLKCIEVDGKLIQRADPIFLDPTESNVGSAHFCAPNKLVMGKLIPTYWFNIGIIWLMSISLIVMLYFDVFKRVLDLAGNSISFKKKY